MRSPESRWRLYQNVLQFIEETEENEDIEELGLVYHRFFEAMSDGERSFQEGHICCTRNI
eukprot:8205228-Ditylum_brightwellii.AAC.1